MSTQDQGASRRGQAPARAHGGLSEWLDRSAGRIFIMPAVVMILVFSIFPLIASLVLALSRVRLRAGGYQVRFVGWRNFDKQLFGSEQWHFLGTLKGMGTLGWLVSAAVAMLLAWWWVRYPRSSPLRR